MVGVLVPYLIVEGNVVSFPLGYRFDPSDEELVMQYLSKKVLSLPMLPFPDFVMPVVQFRHADPWDLQGGEDEVEKFFYTQEEPELMQRGIRMKRVSDTGVWRERGEKTILSPDHSDIIAMKRTYRFERTRVRLVPNRPHATWTMHEYRLIRTDALNQHLSMTAQANKMKAPKVATHCQSLCEMLRCI
ncbi:NAC domain protein [Rhynchospora pubera]|uniref:NAC domain protein n=1 Tax=Rhynchospora pubera TaxID=906938 RepID=A0AAV8HH64_9POAL|nr:NAC domain protein [Rhynchospora pubera]